jgi:hypothetical protein
MIKILLVPILVMVGLIGGIGLAIARTTAIQEASFAVAPKAPAPTGADALPAYDTVEEAAVHDAERLYKCSRAYECAGVIAQRPDGKFVVGPVRSSYSGDSVEYSLTVPMGWKLAAAVHTHPCNAQSHANPYFSPQDINGYLTYKVLGIMVNLCDGKVHEFDWTRDPPNNESPPEMEGTWMTQGRIVGQITVDGVSQEPNQGM